MYRLLLVLALLPLLGTADIGESATKQYNIDIVAVDRAGRQTNLTHDPAVDIAPAVARDGRIVFVSTRGGPSSADLYVMDGNGRNVRRLTNGAADQSGVVWDEVPEWSQASWSPHGANIAFDGQYGAGGPDCLRLCVDWDVRIIGANGSGLKKIALAARAPEWSTKDRLANESDVDRELSAGSLTITRLDGSGSVQVKAFNRDSSVGPVWSPSGAELAFQAQRTDGARNWIYVVRADGTHKRCLAAGHDPTWSPDGRRPAFIENCKLITIDRDGRRR